MSFILFYNNHFFNLIDFRFYRLLVKSVGNFKNSKIQKFKNSIFKEFPHHRHRLVPLRKKINLLKIRDFTGRIDSKEWIFLR
jgi:hypothetical protein